MASHTEKFLLEWVAPTLLNSKVKVVILAAYAVFTGFCIKGCFDMRTYTNLEMMINESYVSYDFLQVRDRHWVRKYEPIVYVKLNETTDIFSEDAQL